MKRNFLAFAVHLGGKGKGEDPPLMRRRNFLRSITGICAMATLAGAQEELRKSMIVRSRCVGCGDCVRQCPMTALSLDNGKAVVDQSKCVGCHMCLMTCSFGAPRI
jgi:Fe-S-cluster-containing hydrogenase component 2